MNRHAWTLFLSGLVLFTLAACAGIPTVGPVQQVGPSPTSAATGGVDIDPQPPEPGADPELILAGFLAAMSTFEGDFVSARLYLTPEAQTIWNPDLGATIYESENSRPVTTATTASMNVPVVGRLDAEGRYQAARDNVVHDFGMAQVQGEWRISKPPEGLLIARYVFDRYYHPMRTTFLTADGLRFAQEQIYVHSTALTPTNAVRAVLAGPSPWLAPAVTSAIPGDTRMSVNAVTVRDGIAEVSLTEQIVPLSERQRSQLAAQLSATLAQFDQVRGVRVLANGQPWQVPGQNAEGVVTPLAFGAYELLDAQVDSPLYGVKDGRVGLVGPGDAPDNFRPLPGALGQENWGDAPGQLAVHRSGDTIAIVNQKRTALYVSGPDSQTVTVRHTGVNLSRPQVLPDRSVWVVDHAGQKPTLVTISAAGAVSRVALPELGDRTVVSFQVSPDRARLALVVNQGEAAQFGLMRIRGTSTLTVDGWRVLPVTSTSGLLTTARAVAWSDPETMLLVAATDSRSAFNIFRVRVDGSSVENLGPSGAGGLPTVLSAFPRRQGTSAVFLNDAGEAYRFEGAYRWQRLASELSTLTLAG